MKTAKDLIIPFSWDKRRVEQIDRRFLYIPDQLEHEEKRLSLFETPLPICIEFCSGNGQWIVERAKRFPNMAWIAVEKKFDRARKIWLNMNRAQIDNLMVVCSDASEFTRWYSPIASQIFINFPDPWPKRRHEKKRLVQAQFLRELLNIVEIKGKATCATDDLPYAKQMLEEFAKCKEWKLIFHSNEWPDYGSSFFQELWKGKGRTIHYLSFERIL